MNMLSSNYNASLMLDKKIEHWKNSILDLGKRNRLIHSSIPKDGGRTSRGCIRITSPEVCALYKSLAVNENELRFTISDNERAAEIITNQSAEETQKTLLNLRERAKLFIEERGINALYLAFGFLIWRENGNVGDELRSPLLLVPVTIDRKDILSPFIISKNDEEVTTNAALAYKFKRDFGITFPEFNGGDINEYFNEIKTLTGGTIEQFAELSLFSFTKMNMYIDICENIDKIKQSDNVNAVAGKSINTGVSGAERTDINNDCAENGSLNEHIDFTGYDHDSTNYSEQFTVVDADSSQQDAILYAKRGASFILQGPPGTGKSQTITNIIAEMLADGKKVLFISEKMAALEVVSKRLNEVGIGDFCLNLHSHQSKRRDILSQLETSLKLSEKRFSIVNGASEKLETLQKQRKFLNDYAKALHTPVLPLNKTIYQIYGELTRVESSPPIAFSIGGVEKISDKDFVSFLAMIDEFADILKKTGWQSDNPWQGSVIKKLGYELRGDIIAMSDRLCRNFENGESVYNLISENISLFGAFSYAACERLDVVLDKIQKVTTEYSYSIFKENIGALKVRFDEKYSSFFARLGGSYKTDKKKILGSKRGKAKTKYADLTKLLAELYEIETELKSLVTDYVKFDITKLENTVKNYSSVLKEFLVSVRLDIDSFAAFFADKKTVYERIEPVKFITNCKNNLPKLEPWIDYRDITERCVAAGLGDFIKCAAEKNLPVLDLSGAFKKRFYYLWLDRASSAYPSISGFKGYRQNGTVEDFRKNDKEQLKIAGAILISRLSSRLPNIEAFTSARDEVGLLRKEITKQRKQLPIRKLFDAIPNLLSVLKPCIMMSPLSVSTYLSGGGYTFDAVIFDEASQIRTEDAICALFRAKQAIIVGDSRQLPPTNFFSASNNSAEESENEDDYDDTGAYESLLDEAAMLPTKTLLWHYRSRHEHLIAFSNAKIYSNSLITFPSAVESAPGLGVEYIRVSGGYYDRGGRRGNIIEAERVADLVFEHFDNYPSRSLGIIAFGEAQQEAIREAVDRRRKDNSNYEDFFRNDGKESFFIKNLETVQGDERDTVIFSIGYAHDQSGKFIMNFGPLNKQGGERRLNVAITRSRYNLKLVGSILPTDIILSQVSLIGPKLLRDYIDFAINGQRVLLGENIDNGKIEHESPFEESVYNYLVGFGYNVATRVGCSGYKIDLAVRQPSYDSVYAIGIECDGASYHSSRTARERDRLRQDVLENMGWHFHRIWSTDWIKNKLEEGERLINAVQTAIADYNYQLPTAPRIVETTNYLNVNDNEKEAYKPPSFGRDIDRIPRSELCITMETVLRNSYGIDKENLIKAVAKAYGWSRVGSKIDYYLNNAYDFLIRTQKINEVDGKVRATTSYVKK